MVFMWLIRFSRRRSGSTSSLLRTKPILKQLRPRWLRVLCFTLISLAVSSGQQFEIVLKIPRPMSAVNVVRCILTTFFSLARMSIIVIMLGLVTPTKLALQRPAALDTAMMKSRASISFVIFMSIVSPTLLTRLRYIHWLGSSLVSGISVWINENVELCAPISNPMRSLRFTRTFTLSLLKPLVVSKSVVFFLTSSDLDRLLPLLKLPRPQHCNFWLRLIRACDCNTSYLAYKLIFTITLVCMIRSLRV